ncbi:unnamed protein product [Symbiodinium sp. CCMP2592]|nr:unnamed protein product [Symbiodinium sp. CCMP2592]
MQTSPMPTLLGTGLSWQRTRAAWAVSAVAPGAQQRSLRRAAMKQGLGSWALAGGTLLLCSRLRGHGWSRSRREAVIENDEHVIAIRRWLDDVIIGYNFCPYARPTDEAQQVRIVTSSSISPEGVLEDLSMEAVRLPTVAQKEIDPGQPATTLLVCPHVPEWESFDDFRAFYDTELSNGYIFAEQDLYIVYFHPSYGRGAETLEKGDVIDFGGDAATVLDTAAGFGASGQPLAKVRLGSGEESFIELPTPPDHTEQVVSSAPRPALHLRLGHRELQGWNDAICITGFL